MKWDRSEWLSAAEFFNYFLIDFRGPLQICFADMLVGLMGCHRPRSQNNAVPFKERCLCNAEERLTFLTGQCLIFTDQTAVVAEGRNVIDDYICTVKAFQRLIDGCPDKRVFPR